MKEYIRTSGFGIIWASTHRFPLCVPTPFKLPCSRIPVPFTVRRPESELRLQPDFNFKGPLIYGIEALKDFLFRVFSI